MLKRILCLFFLLIFAAVIPASAKYYQYTGPDGAVHFTDNIAEVPEDQRPGVKSYREIEPDQAVPQEAAATGEGDSASGEPASGSGGTRPATAAPSSNTWDGKLKIRAADLDREKAELDRKFGALEAERSSLGEPPLSDASMKDVQAYEDKVNTLNEKIKAYDRENKAFKEKVAAFNEKLENPRGAAKKPGQ
ncbi:MAG: DUF4124 domain-containing protein [Deltaproteobacteria bacterium]|nr:DUF4124 domain-containing protein [Deltaproteobacteria bacterium]